MRHRRAEHEGCASASRSFERDRFLARFEDHELTVREPLVAGQRSLADGDPPNAVTSGRCIRPLLPRLERDQQVIDPAWSPHRTRRGINYLLITLKPGEQ